LPGQYEFPADATAKEIVFIMLYRFDQQLNDKVKERLTYGNLSIDQWVTVASLIEQGEPEKSNRPFFARELYNRLNRGQKLEVRSVPSPYSQFESYHTFVHPGLPPGPMNNPGMASLKVALYPAPR
jgi:cell division protein YceG involved in septum cleavage